MKKILLIFLFLLPAISSYSQIFTKPETDDYLHLSAGYVLGSGFTGIASYYKLKRPYLYGLGAATIVGAAKEGYDALGYGTPEVIDFWMTFMGGCLGSMVVKIPLSREKKFYIEDEEENPYKK